nr:zinc-alpha-2-glycoprotein-like [Gorilla gorilla gorilla]
MENPGSEFQRSGTVKITPATGLVNTQKLPAGGSRGHSTGSTTSPGTGTQTSLQLLQPQCPREPAVAARKAKDGCWRGLEGGHYSLTYLYTGLSRPGKGTHRLQGTVFLNGRAFFHYNSEDRKAEPLGPWRHVEGVEDWEKQSQLQKAREDIFMETLKDIVEYYNDSNGQ